MVAIVLITVVIALLGAMAAKEVMAFKDYPWVSHNNIIPIGILLIALGAFLYLIV